MVLVEVLMIRLWGPPRGIRATAATPGHVRVKRMIYSKTMLLDVGVVNLAGLGIALRCSPLLAGSSLKSQPPQVGLSPF